MKMTKWTIYEREYDGKLQSATSYMIRVLFLNQVAKDNHIIIKQCVKKSSNERKLLKTAQKLKIKNFCDIEI